jgi:hypothetical protein
VTGTGAQPEVFVTFVSSGSKTEVIARGKAATMLIHRIRSGKTIETNSATVIVTCGSTGNSSIKIRSQLKLQPVSSTDSRGQDAVPRCELKDATGKIVFISAIDERDRRRAIIKFANKVVALNLTCQPVIFISADRTVTALIEYESERVRQTGEDGVAFPAKINVSAPGVQTR